jgi:hypothetical protein
MSKAAKDLIDAIKLLTATGGMLTAKVVTVDKNNNSCDVSIDGNELGEVRLQAVVDTNRKGCRLYPAVGSDVVIEQMDDNGNWVVALYSEIEEVVFEIGDISLQMNAEGIVFNGGSLDGLVKISDLVTKLNHVEDDLNALKTVFKNAWVVVPSDGGAALKTAAATWANGTITKTVKADLENTKVKQ